MGLWADEGALTAYPYTDIEYCLYSFVGEIFNDDAPINAPISLRGAVTFGMPTVAGIVVGGIPDLRGAVTFAMPTVAGVIVQSTVLRGAVTFAMPTAKGIIGRYLRGAVTFGMPTVAGVIVATTPSVSGNVTFAMPTIAGIITFPLSSKLTCLVMNMKNKGVSQYESFTFNSGSYFNGSYYLCGADGLYTLIGGTDNGTAIAAHVTTGVNDFGARQRKNISDIYTEVEGTGAVQVSTIIDKGAEGTAQDITLPGTGIANRRAKMPLGDDGTRHQIKFANVSGADFELHGMELIISGGHANRRQT